MHTTSITALCNTIMRGVVATGAINHSNLDTAVAVIRAEVKDLLHGSEEYQDARAAVLDRTISDSWVIRLVVLNCAEKIRAAPADFLVDIAGRLDGRTHGYDGGAS